MDWHVRPLAPYGHLLFSGRASERFGLWPTLFFKNVLDLCLDFLLLLHDMHLEISRLAQSRQANGFNVHHRTDRNLYKK
jgi:hypothetical protein